MGVRTYILYESEHLGMFTVFQPDYRIPTSTWYDVNLCWSEEIEKVFYIITIANMSFFRQRMVKFICLSVEIFYQGTVN